MNAKLKPYLLSAALVVAIPASQAHADTGGVGIGVGYGLFAGPTLELNYAVNSYFQVRGSLSDGMGVSMSEKVNDVDFRLKNTTGGINRLAVNYHPFQGNFFLSAGYAFNQYKLRADGRSQGNVTVGDTTYNVDDIRMRGELDWDNAPSLTLGWGHSPNKGWGAMLEVGALFTGAANAKLSATGTVSGTGDDINSVPGFQESLNKEERKLRDEVSKVDFLPVLQAQVTYRF